MAFQSSQVFHYALPKYVLLHQKNSGEISPFNSPEMLSESPEIFWSVDDIVFFIIGISKCGPSETPWPICLRLCLFKRV